MPAALVARFVSAGDPRCVDALWTAVCSRALELEQDWHDEVNKIYRARREKVFELLKLLGCEFDTSQAGMFVWASIPAQYKDGYQLSDKVLYDANVFITPGGIFGSAGNNFIRVSLCSPEQKFDEAIIRIKTSKN